MSSTSHRPELELLRRQVADLARELAERDRVLHEQTRHLEVAQALAHLGSWNWDIASGEVEWSDELYRIFGYEPRARAITFDSFVSAVLPDDHDRVLASIDDALAGAATYDMECRIVRPDGDVRTIHCCGEVARDSGGQPLRMSGAALDITERKRVEAMVRTSQEKLRQALRASGTGLWDWNTETNEVSFSEEWKHQLGYESAEIADSFEAWKTLLHPEDRDAAMAYVHDYVSHRERDYRQEFRLKHKNGEYRWIEARASFVTEPDGRQIRLLGSHADITDRKWMEESVRESEEWYRTLVELSPSGVFVFSEGRTAYVNPTGVVLLGANAAQEILDRSTFEFIHPDYHQEVRENVKRLLSGGMSVHSAERIYLKMDGTPIPVQVEAARITWNGKPAILGLFSDITERKRAEQALADLNATLERQVSDRTEALRRSEERFRQFFENAPNVTCLKDHHGRYLYTNPRFDEVFGFATGMALGKTDEELFSPEQAAQFRSHDQQVLTSGRGQEFEEITQQEDGPHTSIVVKFPLTDAAGHLSAIGAIATDVTERNRVQEALRESEARWQQFAESVSSAFWIADVTPDERKVLYVNSAFTDIWGIEREEIYQNWFLWLDSIHPDDRARVKADHDRFVGGGATAVFHCEYRIVGRDGYVRWISDRRVRMAGREHRIAGIAEDITHLKQQLALMAQTEAMGNIGGWELDFLTNRLWWSDETYRLHETTPELYSPTVDTAVNFYTPESRPVITEAFQKGEEQGEAWDLELELNTAKGRPIAVRAAGKIEVVNGRAVRAYGTFQDITERKRAEEALRNAHDELERKVIERTAELQASEERFRSLYDETPSMYFTVDGMGIIRSVNEYGARYLGYRVEDLVGKSVEAIIFEADRECICAKMEAFFRHPDGVAQWEFRKVRGDGTVLWVREFARVLQREAGASLALIVCDDITERRHAGEALRESEERFSKAFRTSPHPIGITEAATGRCIEVNDACLQLFGFRREEVIGHTTLMLGIWPNLEERVRVIERLKAGQPVRNMEFVLKTKSGALRYLLTSADLAELNGTLCVVTVANDITERKQAEEALRMSEERFAKAFQASPHPVVISELDSGLVVDANDAACQLFAYRKEEVVGRTTQQIGLWPSTEARDRYLELLKRKGSVRNVEVALRSKSGEIRQCLLSSELIELHGKQCSVTVGDDITESKHLEKALRLTQFSVDQAVEAILWLDSNARIFSVNDTACQMLEYSREQLLAMTVHDIDPNFPVERWVTHWNYLKQQGALTFDAKFWSRSGFVLQTDVTVNYLQHEGKEYACMIMRDVAERKRAEAELHRSHTFLRQVIDTDPDLIFAKDRDGRFTVANKAVADWYGTTVEDLIGKSDADFNANTEEVAFFRHNDREVMNSGQDRFIPEEKITDSRGRTRWLQTVKRPIFDDQGQVHMVLGAATDITERKRMEEILVQRERDLSAALQERERISQDLHDGILQSLYAVGLGLEACKPLIRKRRDPVAKKFMATLDHAIRQLNQVMTEVRNFIAGLESQVLQGGDFSTALRTMVETMSIASSTRCRVRIDDEAARRLSTEQALHIINIVREGVSNALRHSRAKQITVSLRDLIRSDRLAVTDDGIGFNSRSVQGVGHGLVNMAARAQKVRGLFAIQSKPDKGTRISLDLPKDTHYAHN
jgi:PAS domain S-box-containing protein